MKTIKLELSVKLLLGAIALGLFLNAFKDFPPKANANTIQQVEVVNDIQGIVKICNRFYDNTFGDMPDCVDVSKSIHAHGPNAMIVTTDRSP